MLDSVRSIQVLSEECQRLKIVRDRTSQRDRWKLDSEFTGGRLAQQDSMHFSSGMIFRRFVQRRLECISVTQLESEVLHTDF